MMKTCITNGKVILKDKVVNENVYIEDGYIVEVSNRIPVEEKIVDAKGLYVSPGFIDVHVHGRLGSDAMYNTFKDINNISNGAIKTGVTAFLPTTMTMGVEDTYCAIKNIVENINNVEGSKILGVHMEGPFFNLKYKGAQPAEYMIAPTIENFNKLVKEYTSFIKKISLAPEIENTTELIKHLVKNKIIVSMGHTNATYEEAKDAIALGITSGTHTYNAMTPLTHRNPGVVGAIMDDCNVYAELILDGIHVHYTAANILLKTKGLDKVILITDSMEAAGLEDGEYKIGNQPVFVKDNSARLADGTLAGSVLSLNNAVKNAYQSLKLPIYSAVNLASLNPANSLNLYDCGEIAVNKKADIIMFDEEIDIKFVMIDGKVKIGG